KESTDPRLSQLCPPYVTPSSSSSLEYHRSDARIVENGFAAGSGMSNSAKVGLGRVPPDGYTLLQIGTPNAINATPTTNVSFNFVRDIAPVGSITRVAYVVVVHPSVPAKTIPELIAYAKANPGRINMASAGNGTPQHVVGELFKMMAGVDMVHVPYRGGAPATNHPPPRPVQ